MNYQFKPSQLFFASVLLIFSLTTFAQAPKAAMSGYESGSKISKEIFKTLPDIGVYIKDAPFEVKYQVVSYTVTMVDNENMVKNVTCQGSAFSALAKKYINDYAKSGDIISIQKIIAKTENGTEVKVPALIYSIE